MTTAEIRSLPVDLVRPCGYQPRANVSVRHVRRLADTLRRGSHQPLILVEPHPDDDGSYQIVWGEQRWRAAVEAGHAEILAQVRPCLGYLERLELQLEENRLRRELDPCEEGFAILLDRDLRATAKAERILADAGVPFTPLSQRNIKRREEFGEHLCGLVALMQRHGLRGSAVSSLCPWRETERALGLSESARKVLVGLLRLAPDVREEVRRLPLEHAAAVSRLPGEEDQREIAALAIGLSHREVKALVASRLGDHEQATSDNMDGGDLLAFETQLARVADVCRQLVRLVVNLAPRLSDEERGRVALLLDEVVRRAEELRPA